MSMTTSFVLSALNTILYLLRAEKTGIYIGLIMTAGKDKVLPVTFALPDSSAAKNILLNEVLSVGVGVLEVVNESPITVELT